MCLSIKRYSVSLYVDFLWGLLYFKHIFLWGFVICILFKYLNRKFKQKNKNVFVLESWIFSPSQAIIFNDLLKWDFLKGFYYAYTAGLALKWLASIAMRNREKRDVMGQRT